MTETADWQFGVAVEILAMGLADRPYLVGNSFTRGGHPCRPHAPVGEERETSAWQRFLGNVPSKALGAGRGNSGSRHRQKESA